jgi:hypothetical protein
MSIARTPGRLELPQSLRNQLHGFRRRVWTIKMAEAACAAAFGVLVAYLVLFALDRVWETPAWPRLALFAVLALGLTLVPIALYRWVWRRRRFEQLARLLARTQPGVGDPLLGIIELVRDESEQARSRTLCEAAIRQVADDARGRDLRAAVPQPRHRFWAALAAVPAIAALALFALYPAAASNAWARLLAPWKPVPRYTFAAVAPLPARIVVAHGEPFTVAARLTADSAWHPAHATARLGAQPSVTAALAENGYEFTLPPQIDAGTLVLRIGDAVRRVRVEPLLRPELKSVVAEVALPAYLERPKPLRKDVRGGSISLVKGSQVRFTATAGRALAEATVDGRPVAPDGAAIVSPRTSINGPRTLVFAWRDEFGLSGKEPFRLAVNGRDDEAPTVACEGLPRQRVVLDSEQLTFNVRAQDDFGVRRVGLEWQAVEDSGAAAAGSASARGERILAAGGPEKEAMELAGTFSAKALGIEPQPIHVRLFAEDYFPDRPRVYSATYTLYVLNAEQHAIWITEQLSKWHRQSLEVRDREMQLLETNKQLRAMTPEELDRPETRRRIENQATAERANGRRLSGLVTTGEDLVQQAMRNPEFGVGHLEKWAEMLQILKDISGNRMPTVADLLDQGAKAPTLAGRMPGKAGPMAGQVRSTGAGSSATPKEAPKAQSTVPQVVDQESSQQPPNNQAGSKPSPSKGGAPRLTLPRTTLVGSGKPGEPPPPSPAGEKLDEAVVEQEKLLAEFEKVADELNRILGNLEGSTLVKRLKAAARQQLKVAGRLGDVVNLAFGGPTQAARTPEGQKSMHVLGAMAEEEAKATHDVSLIMDDMQAYFERRRLARFQSVLDEMRQQDVVGSLRQLGDDLKKEAGLSIAQCEFWSDTLDRWAEDLVDPACSGTCPGSKSRSSLPPSIVLEVLQILEGEVNLREETRVAQQARGALTSEEYQQQADALSRTQEELRLRVELVARRIAQLPDGENQFAYEIALLSQVDDVMGEAADILARPETGSPAIAAETEAIELLLQSRRINPRAGGGGGANPGGGGTGTTNDSALALVGGGVNAKEVREDHGIAQATGETGRTLPEEFRAGLDEYFNRLDREPGSR